MPNKFHGQHSVWPIIKNQIRRVRKTQQIFAAIAYIGKDASTLMPLRKGDILVCNASDVAIKLGSTSAKALEIFNNRGVQIFNESRLHGKVVVFSKRAFIGSANVSIRSRDLLYEAVVETTDQKIVDSSLQFVKNLCKEFSRLDSEDIRRLKRIKTDRPPPPPPPPFKRFVLPKEVSLLHLVPVSRGVTLKQSEAMEKEEISVRAEFFEGISEAGIVSCGSDSDWWDIEKPGTWIINVLPNGQMLTPTQIIKLSKLSKNSGISWQMKPLKAKNSVRDLALLSKLRFDWDSDEFFTLKNEQTRALLKLFKKN